MEISKKSNSPRRCLVDEAHNASMTQLYYTMRHQQEPGWWIKRLPDEKRELLRKLKSDDIKNDGLPK